ncbi:MAG: hypothetical protein ACFFE4_21250 [Candidatus Thorarchaeota archaeon]
MEEFEITNNDPIELVGYNNLQTRLLALFSSIIEKFNTSYECFSSVLQEYHQKLNKIIPSNLKKELKNYIVMLFNDYFGGCGCYPKNSPFNRIPEEDLLRLCRTYFKEESGFRDEVIVYLMYCFYIKPFEYIKINRKTLENSEILKKIPQKLRTGIMKDYIEKFSFPIDVSTETKQEMERTGLLPLKISQRILPQYINTRFQDLSRIDKKVLLDLVWSAYVIAPYDKRRFTDMKFSVDDKEMLVDLAINDYLELYNHFYKNTKD